MKGLLIKDFLLLKNNKQFFVMIIIMGVMFSIAWDNPFFAMSYLTILFTMFTVSTITYDEYDNGMAYLFSLPVSRKDYVREKYIYGGIIAAGTIAGSSVMALVYLMIKSGGYSMEEWGSGIWMSLFMAAAALAVMVPLQLKFGAEKGRIAMSATIGCIVLAVFLIVKLASAAGVEAGRLVALLDTHVVSVVTGSAVTGIVLLLVSYVISVKIISKKEF